MNMQNYTFGRLRVVGTTIRNCQPGIDAVATMQVSNQPNWDRDARRLVACWNACEGLSTESLERSGPLADQIVNAMNKAYRAEHDPLREFVERLASSDPMHSQLGVLAVAEAKQVLENLPGERLRQYVTAVDALITKLQIDMLDNYGLWAEHDAVIAARANIEV